MAKNRTRKQRERIVVTTNIRKAAPGRSAAHEPVVINSQAALMQVWESEQEGRVDRYSSQVQNAIVRANQMAQNLGGDASMARGDLLRFLMDGIRDINAECGFPDWLTPDHYRAMYDRDGVFRRIIHNEPEACWVFDPEVYEDEDNDHDTPFEAAWKNLVKKANIYYHLCRIDVLSGIGQYGILLIGINDKKDLREPVDGVEEYVIQQMMEDIDATPDQDTDGDGQDETDDSFDEEDDQPEDRSPKAAFGLGQQQADPTQKPDDRDEPTGKKAKKGKFPTAGLTANKFPPTADIADEEEPTDDYEKPSGDPTDDEDGNGQDDAKQDIAPPMEPAEYVGKRYKLLYLRPFSEEVTFVKTRETDVTSPRFGLPTMYTIQFRDFPNWGIQAGEIISRDVHWTRVIHVADNKKMSEVYGIPRGQQSYNYVVNVRKVSSGGAEAHWKSAFPGFAFEVNPELADQDIEMDKEGIRQEFERFQNSTQRYMAVQGVTTKPLAPTVTDPSPNIEIQLKLIAITLNTPFRILFGSETEEHAGDNDSETWHKKLAGRCNKYIGPQLMRPFIDRFVAFGILPKPKQICIEWQDFNTPSDLTKAQVSQAKATALAAYNQVGSFMDFKYFLTYVMGCTEEEAEEMSKYHEEMRQQDLMGGGQFGQDDAPPQTQFDENGEPLEPDNTGEGAMDSQDQEGDSQNGNALNQTELARRGVKKPIDSELVNAPAVNSSTAHGPDGRFITGENLQSGQRVEFHSGEHAGHKATITGQIQKRYSKEDTTYRLQVDGFPKVGGWNGQITGTAKHLKEHAKAVIPPAVNKAMIALAMHLNTTVDKLTSVPPSLLERWTAFSNMEMKNPITANRIKKRGGKYFVTSEDGKKNLGGPYGSRERASLRLQQVEYFKHKKPVGNKYAEGEARAKDGKWTSGGGSSQGGQTQGGTEAPAAMIRATFVGEGKTGKWQTAMGTDLPGHIKRIPPAWTDVVFSHDPSAKLLVQGKDKKGRVQSVYSDVHTAMAAAKKFDKVREMLPKHEKLGMIHRGLTAHPEKGEAAKVMSVIHSMGLRPGSEADTGAEKQAYGATTLQGRHVKVKGSQVSLAFTGKKGVALNLPVHDQDIAKLLINAKEKAGDKGKLFNVTDADLRGYAHEHGGYNPKDYRTALGTKTAQDVISTMKRPGDSPSAFKKAVNAVGDHVSAVLGNTRSIALASYIDPSVFEVWKGK